MKIETRVTEAEIRKMLEKGGFTLDEIHEKVQQFQLQELKDKQAQDIDYELIQPKQLNYGGDGHEVSIQT